MRFAIVIILLASVMLAGCSNVSTRIVEKDRVDQQMQQGNRGYLLGTPPPAEDRENLKRTMIGIDVEIPLLPGERTTAGSSGTPEVTNFEPKVRAGKVGVVEEEIVEEEWVK